LRQRREDIPLLAADFLGGAAERHHKRIEGFSPETIEILSRYDWPGNVRELRNEIDRAVALARDGDSIQPSHLTPALGELGAGSSPAGTVSTPELIATRAATRPAPAPEQVEGKEPGSGSLRKARAAFEARHITEALRQHQGNVSRTAQALGLSRAALQKKMKAYGLR